MHIQESPVEGIKRDFAGFELDASKIELHSANKSKIRLPYSGQLLGPLQDNDGAYISVGISAGLMVGVGLIIKTGRKERYYPVEATTQEINDLLYSFFFVKKDLLTAKVPEYCGILALFNGTWCLVGV